MKRSKVYQVRVSEELLSALHEKAEKEYMPLSIIVRKLMRDWLGETSEKEQGEKQREQANKGSGIS